MIIVRMGIFVLFFKWRISAALSMISSTGTADKSTVLGMWMVSITGELWFALMWVLDQLPKMQPVRRTVYVSALDESMLPTMDVFVTTVDTEKEPSLVTVNTILSILAADYPAEKLTCYVSDDGGALLTRDAVTEASRFAGLWVPFCRKHAVEPRNPEAYFSPGVSNGVVKARRGDYKGRVWPELARDRRRVRREYEELRLQTTLCKPETCGASSGRRRRRPMEAAGGVAPWKIMPELLNWYSILPAARHNLASAIFWTSAPSTCGFQRWCTCAGRSAAAACTTARPVP
jgi:hypothetical protein